jgi:phosphatidylglycerol:prolipoprotein diacylglycerol transferase
MILNYINWNLDPEIFHLGPLSIRYYGILFALSFYMGYVIMLKFFKKENLSTELLDKLTLYVAFGTVLGARLGHVLFYQPAYYLSNPLEILKIWHGGLASHGAAIGILLALYLFSRKHKKPYLWALDKVAIVVALAGFFIRTGNLMNSEIYGHVTDLPWGFVFERNGEILPKHPTQIYEALSYLVIFALLYFLHNKKSIKLKKGTIFGLFMALLFSVRFLVEFIKEVQVSFEKSMVLDMGQILSIPCILTGIGIIVYNCFFAKQKE